MSLGSAQQQLSETTAARDRFQTEVGSLTTNAAQLASERDALHADLAKTRADIDRLTRDLSDARTSLSSASADRDRAQDNLETVGHAALLMADISLYYERSSAVQRSVQRLTDFIRTHPTEPPARPRPSI